MWVDGTTASFTNWKNNPPSDNGKKGDVAVIKMKGDSDDGKWWTKKSNSARRYICECPAGPCTRQ